LDSRINFCNLVCNQFLDGKVDISYEMWLQLHAYISFQKSLALEFNLWRSSSWYNFNLFKYYRQCMLV
jgi:hypothetical protein